MVGVDLYDIRKFTSKKLQSKVNTLAKKMQQFELDKISEQVDKPDLLQGSETFKNAVGFHGPGDASVDMRYQKLVTSKNYYYCMEPDLKYCQLLFFANKFLENGMVSSQIQDYSDTGKTINVYGSPYRKDSGFDLGYSDSQFKSWSNMFNSPLKKDGITVNPTENQEYIEILDHIKLQHANVGAGISIFIRIKPLSFVDQNSITRHLLCKIDDSSGTNGKILRINNSGKLVWHYKVGATQYKAETVDSLTVGNWYDVWVTYKTSDNSVKIYVNNVDQSVIIPSDIGFPTSASLNMQVLRRASNSSGGYTYAEIHYGKIFVDYVVSATEVSNHWTNKLSITNIPFGQVGVYDQSIYQT